MGRPSRLGDEDRSDYADVLDEVLASAEIRRLLERSGVSAGWLRTRALAAAARTAPAAAAEHRAYAALRRAHHDRVPDGGRPSLSGPGSQERPGAGVLAVLGVLTPILAAVAATTFLLLGYGLRLTDSLADLADTLVRVGWVSLAIAAATSLISLVALYRTAALQSAPGSPSGPSRGEDRSPDLDRARDAWRTALRDKAIRPFLLQELAEAADGTGEVPEGRSRPAPPAFTGPDFSAPDFTAPDFSGPGAHTRPAYSRPDFTGPGFSGPGAPGA